jgi:chromosomal replication initiation ATPase DnaA
MTAITNVAVAYALERINPENLSDDLIERLFEKMSSRMEGQQVVVDDILFAMAEKYGVSMHTLR